MFRTAVMMAASLALTSAVVAHAYYLKHQFYPTVVYLTKSSPSMAVLYLQAFVLVFLLGKFMGKVFFGQLRAAEMEHLLERSWYVVTETCLAFTVFRDDFSPRFVALFTLLFFLKCFHWLAEDRVDFMERSPNISWLFHFRIFSLMLLLGILDFLFVSHAYHSILTRGASAQLVFGFEYAILMTMVLTIFIKYILHSIDLQSENPWDNKAVYMLYTELFTGFIKVLLYLAFMTIMVKVHTFPLFAIRPMYLALRQFKKAVTDAIMSRRAIRNMNTLYHDATPEELQAMDNVCIICREEMVTGAKRLPCNHIFHTSCLRSWFQRQQTCPTCRMDVLRASLPPQSQAPPEQQEQGQQHQQHQTPLIPQPPNSSTSRPSGDSGSDTAPAGTLPGFPFPPPWMGMPLPPLFGFPPMPVPPAGFAGLTDEELRAMEGHERQHLEARLQCLQNIHTLLDAAMLQINQYLTVLATIGTPRSAQPPSFPSASTSTQETPSTESTLFQPADSTSAPGTAAPPPSPPPAAEPNSSGQAAAASSVEGYTEPAGPEEDGEQPLPEEPDTAELRRRRLQKLELPSPPSH
uniref:RING-type E3 ubiquitin transferase n=1 Tax=Sphenodon punctatus TaxID=8508 RepID=A0A8D0G4A2_SPHPU